MKYDIDLEIKVESAVQEYAISVRSNKNVENAMNWLTDATNQLPLEETLHAASIDKSSIVRRVAAEFHIKDIDQLSKYTAIKYARNFEKDTSPTVSERGKFALGQLNSNT